MRRLLPSLVVGFVLLFIPKQHASCVFAGSSFIDSQSTAISEGSQLVWGLDQNLLTADSVILFQRSWEQYSWRILGAVTFMFLQALLIIGLLINRAKRRKAEDSLKLNEKRYRNVVETQTELICRYRSDSTLTFVNDAYCRYFGKAREELIGTKFIELVPEHAQGGALNRIMTIIKDQSNDTYDHQVLLPSGETGWQQWIDRVVENNGNGIELQGIGCDITEKRRAEEELRQSEARFREMADTAPVFVFILDSDLQCTFLNQYACDFAGRRKEELLGESGFALVHDEDRERCLIAYSKAKTLRRPIKLEFRACRFDGEYRWLYHNAIPRFASDGEFRGYIGTIIDITDRKLTEQALRESENRFRQMADTAPVLIWMADEEGDVTYLNQRCLDFTGRPMEQLTGDRWLQIVHDDDRQMCFDAYMSAYESKAPFVIEYRIRHANGEYRWLYDTGAPRFGKNGELLGYIGTCVDMSERKAAEEALQSSHEEVNRLKNQLEAENIYLQEEIRLSHNIGEIVGESKAIKTVLLKIEQVAQTDTSVLIMGETGTGKELVARAIHSHSNLKDRPFVKVNCAALSPSLIESELFGHEKGAFTGALARKIGRFELADGATIFLDEIGELPLELQPKLLRVIQEGEFERLGSAKTIKANVRIIAATNRDLKAGVQKGSFREDLWYRLNVFPINLPPLRQRKDDIPLMVEHFTRVFSRKVGKSITSISSATMKLLEEHSWPGNVRELSNVIERALVTTQGTVLHVVEQFESNVAEASEFGKTLDEVERDHISRILEQTGWRLEGPTGAARVLGLNPSTLRTRMLKLGIQKSIKTASLSGMRN
jgi:PAS domain S-box-containing protein